MYIKSIVVLGLSALAMSACVPDSNPEDLELPPINIASFYSWPSGETAEADIEAMGRDNIVFVVDRSGSMSYDACSGATNAAGSTKSRSEETRDALGEFIPIIPDDIALGYVEFGSKASITVPLGTGPGVRMQIAQAASQHAGDWGDTNLSDALTLADEMLREQALRQNSTGTYRIVVVTDGRANSNFKLRTTLRIINETPVEVLTAGFCIGEQHALNQPGETVYVNAGNTQDLLTLFTQAVQDESADFAVDFASTSN